MLSIYYLVLDFLSSTYGLQKTKFRTKINNHKSRLTAHQRLPTSDKALDDLIYRHFNQQDHRVVEDVRIQLIDKTVDEQALREREAQWAYRLKTISPLGLKSEDFFSKRNPRRDLSK